MQAVIQDSANFTAYMEVGERHEHDCMDAGARAMQEQLPRSGSFAYMEVGKGREQERKLPNYGSESKLNIISISTEHLYKILRKYAASANIFIELLT